MSEAVKKSLFDVQAIRAEFPILQQKPTLNSKPLTYLDTAASAQKPRSVIQSITDYYERIHSNVHRGVYELSHRATEAYERARRTVRSFINASSVNEIVFTKGTTESINLVAHSFGQMGVRQGDEIIVSTMEHHSNLIPWQLLCERTGAVLKVIRLQESGALDLEHYRQLLNEKTKLVAIVHLSHVLGILNPVQTMIALAHQHGVPVLVDGAQSVARLPIDVQSLDCDFFVFSSHKLYGPTGCGVLYAKEALLERMPPYQGGGGMIRSVTFERTEYHELPNKFEAGTPPIAAALATAVAMDYLQRFGMKVIRNHEQLLIDYAMKQLSEFPGLTILAAPEKKIGVISFVLEKVHSHDVGTVLDHEGIAVRVGHHCAMPLMDFLKLSSTVRVSFGIYNSFEDIDRLIEGLNRVEETMNV